MIGCWCERGGRGIAWIEKEASWWRGIADPGVHETEEGVETGCRWPATSVRSGSESRNHLAFSMCRSGGVELVGMRTDIPVQHPL
jgi:hypothetical protein